MQDNYFSQFDDQESDQVVIPETEAPSGNFFSKFDAEPDAEPAPAIQRQQQERDPFTSIPGVSLESDGVIEGLTSELDERTKREAFQELSEADEKKKRLGVMGESFGLLTPDQQQNWLVTTRQEQEEKIASAKRARQTLERLYADRPEQLARDLKAVDQTVSDAEKRLKDLDAIEKGDAPIATKTGLRSALENAPQAFILSGASVVKFSGIVSGYAKKLFGSEDAPDANVLYNFGKQIDEYSKATFPGDPARADEFGQKLAHGAGNLLSFYGAGSVQLLTKGGPVLVHRIAQGLLPATGAAMQGEQGFAEATAKMQEGADVDETDRVVATFLNALVGTSEAIPVTNALRAVQQAGRVAKIGGAAKQIATGAAEEAAQEFGQTVASDLIAKQTYDPERKVGETAPEAALIGGILGGGMRGGAALIGGLRKQAGQAAQEAPDSTPPAKTDVLSPETVAEDAAAAEAVPTETEALVEPTVPAEEATAETALPVTTETAEQAEIAPVETPFETRQAEVEAIPSEIAAIDEEIGAPLISEAYDRFTPEQKTELADRVQAGEAVDTVVEDIAVQNEDAAAIAALAVRRGLTDEQIGQVRDLLSEAEPALLPAFDELVKTLPKPAETRARQLATQIEQQAVSEEATRQSFADLIDGTTPRRQWAEQLGVTDEQIQPLIQEAIDKGWLRRDKNGNIRRAPKTARTGNIAALAVSDVAPDTVPGEGNVVKTDAAQQRSQAIKAAVDRVAGKILPDDVRVDVVDRIEIAGLKRQDRMLALRAFHGSPHDFTKFDMSKLGSGEGAQAYGHGLYFAENELVAQRYHEVLSKKAATSGRIYQVELDVEPEDLLDWDKPLNEHSAKVRKALEKIPFLKDELAAHKVAYGSEAQGNWVVTNMPNAGGPEGVSRLLKEAGIPGIRFLDQGSRDRSLEARYKGKTDYGGDADLDSAMGLAATHGSVDAALKEIEGYNFPGVEKIRDYLRSGDIRLVEPEASRNIVIFDDSLIKITHKDGTPVTQEERAEVIEDMQAPQDVRSAAQIEERLEEIGNEISRLQRLAIQKPADKQSLDDLRSEREELILEWRSLPDDVRAAKDRMLALRAFHGTPHAVDRFDLGKLGTGEGAQVFGSGLYFAENEKVADSYRVGLTTDKITIGGKPIGEDASLLDVVAAKLYGETQFGQTLADLKKAAQENVDRIRSKSEPTEAEAEKLLTTVEEMRATRKERLAEAEEYLANIVDAEAGNMETFGNLYEVELDVENDQLLDWDKPLSEQGASVKKGLEALGIEPASYRDGKWLMEELGFRRFETPEQASQALKEAGIPGVRFLDQGSRATGEGTRNYVIFDDSLITIKAENGKPVEGTERQRVIDDMMALRNKQPTGQPSPPEALGQTDPYNQLISIAMNAVEAEAAAKGKSATDEAVRVLRHEAVEFFKATGIFTPKEWQLLQRTARQKGWVETTGVRNAYTQLYADALGGDQRLALATKEPAFEKWFKDSKIVDRGGKPLIVYHGGSDVRGIFKEGFVASSRGDVWFAAKDYDVADSYADDRRAFDYENAEPQTVPLYLSIKNPMVVDAKGKHWKDTERYVKEAKDAGHDGIIIENTVDFYNNPADKKGKTTTVYAFFSPTQAKSALGQPLKSRVDGKIIAGADPNIGTFDPNDPRISYALRGQQGTATGTTSADLEDLLVKEAIAEQYSEFHLGRKQFTPAIMKLFQRIKDLLTRTSNALRGMGFQTFEDVFTRIDEGEFKSRFEAAFGIDEGRRQRGSVQTGTAAIQATAGRLADSPARQAKAGLARPGQSLSDLVDAFGKALGLTVRQGRLDPTLTRTASQAGQDVRGQTSRDTGVIRLRILNEIDTLAHEGGHALENRFKGDLEAIKQQFAGELTPLASPGPDAVSEGFAEWFRRYVTNPTASQRVAPQFQTAFEDFLDGQDSTLLQSLQEIRDGYQEWVNAPSGGTVAGSLATTVKEGLVRRVFRQINDNTLKNSVRDWSERIYTAVFDDLNPIRQTVDGLLEIARTNVAPNLGKNLSLKTVDNPYKLLRLARDGYAAGHMDILYGVHGYKDTTPQGPALRDAMITAFGGEASEQWTQEMSENFGAYLVSRRMVQEWQRYQNGELDRTPDKFSMADHQQSIKDFEAAHPEFQQAATMVHEFLQNMLAKKRDAGLITPELYDQLIQKVDYVPVMRDMSDRGSVEGAAPARKDKQSVIRVFRGSQRDVINPLESIAKDAYETAMIIARNDAVKALDALARAAGPDGGKFAERIPAHEMKATQVNVQEAIRQASKDAGIDPADMQIMLQAVDDQLGDNAVAQIWRAGEISEKGEAIIYLWEDGKRIPIRLADGKFGQDMLHAVAGLNRESADWWVNILSLPSTALRMGITTAADFIGANYIRDQVSAWILTRNFVPFYDGARGIYNDLRMRDVSRIYSRAGGIFGGANVAAQHESRIKREVLRLRRRGIRFTLNPMTRDFWRMTEFSETGTRLSVFDRAFDRARKDGLSDWEATLEAAFRARDYIDFGRRGSKMLAARRLIPFFNAALQGLDRGIRGMRGKVEDDRVIRSVISPYIKSRTGQPLTAVERRNMGQAAQVWGYMATLGMLGLGLSKLYEDDEEYEEISDYIKATHWLVKVNDEWVRIPKPFELAIFSNIVERTFDYVYKDDATAMERFKDGLFQILVPPTSIPGISVTTELAADHNFFTGRPIVGDQLKRLPPELQFNAYASEFGKYVGKQVGVSPAYIDHMITGFGASWGREFLNATDTLLPMAGRALDGAGGLPVNPSAEATLQDYFLVRRFTTDPTRGSVSTRQFWDLMSHQGGQFTQAANGYKHLLDKVRDVKGAQEYLDDLPDEEKAYALLQAGQTGSRKSKLRNLHPLNRAREIVTVTNGIKKEINLNRLYRGEKEDAEQVVLSPAEMRMATEMLSDIQMRESRNALVALEVRGWENKTIMDVDGIYAELKAAVPQVHELLVDRLKSKKLPSFETSMKEWPKARERILEEGQDAVIFDLYERDYDIGERVPALQ